MTAPRLDVVLINPGSRARVYQALGEQLAAVENPVWAGLIATFLQKRGCSVEIIDAGGDELAPDDVATRVGELNPHLAVVVVYGHQPSASTQHMPASGAVATALKQAHPSMPLLMLGGHVASLPERTLAEESCDYVAIDEGLRATADLAAALRDHESPDLSKIPGLGYRQNGRAVLTPWPISDLETQMVIVLSGSICTQAFGAKASAAWASGDRAAVASGPGPAKAVFETPGR